MSIEIENSLLEKACKGMIETIFYCLPNAFKGTIYAVGPPPDLIVKRVTSGIINVDRTEISWGLPERSDYNPPGKPWELYRDEPGRPLEAMAWCVERQKSWTAEDPEHDVRSVRVQIDGKTEDFHHMEPVLARKEDLNFDMYSKDQYPKNWKGELIWHDTDYVVVAVIKIHFKPYTIKIGSHETRVIKKLSRLLGTELLSYQLRQESIKAMEELARDRILACNILADSLRNAITKTALIFSLIKQEIGLLREEWERVIAEDTGVENSKQLAIDELNRILMDSSNFPSKLKKELSEIHRKFSEIPFTPAQGKNWIEKRIERRWKELLEKYNGDEIFKKRVLHNINLLKESLRFGVSSRAVEIYGGINNELKERWISLLYQENESFNSSYIEGLIEVLREPSLTLRKKEKAIKNLLKLKALAETMNQLERNTNFLLHHVLNGNNKESTNPLLKNNASKILNIKK